MRKITVKWRDFCCSVLLTEKVKLTRRRWGCICIAGAASLSKLIYIDNSRRVLLFSYQPRCHRLFNSTTNSPMRRLLRVCYHIVLYCTVCINQATLVNVSCDSVLINMELYRSLDERYATLCRHWGVEYWELS